MAARKEEDAVQLHQEDANNKGEITRAFFTIMYRLLGCDFLGIMAIYLNCLILHLNVLLA